MNQYDPYNIYPQNVYGMSTDPEPVTTRDYSYLDLDGLEDYDAEELEADVIKERFDDYVKNYLPTYERMSETVTSPGFTKTLARDSQKQIRIAQQNAESLTNAQRGRMGLSATTDNTSDGLRKSAQAVSGYNSGLRAGTDLQNNLL